MFAACTPEVATLEVAPSTLALRSDAQSQRLTATPKDKDGNPVDGEHTVVWTSSDAAIAAVDAQGLVKPVGSGKATVTAALGEHTANVSVDVVLTKAIRLPSLAAVVVVGVPSEPFAVVFTNEKGEPITPDESVGKLAWKTENPAVATVNDAGVVTGVAAGSTTLTVSTKELKAEMTLTVNPAPEGAAPSGSEPASDKPAAAPAK